MADQAILIDDGCCVVLAHPNMVILSGVIGDTGKNPVARKVLLFKEGETEVLAETTSSASDGSFSFMIEASTADEFRLVAFANESTGDENSMVHQFVNPIQLTKTV